MSKADKSAGDIAIEKAVAGKATNGQFLKALWSIRGDLTVQLSGSDLKVPVVKSSLVNLHKGLPDDQPAEFKLVAEKSGGYSVAALKTRAPKPEKPSAPAPAPAPSGEPQTQE